ncbi:MAG: hypothetical protein P4L31_05190 [Candidatus Babeliales bacterium]|nr:hypothetical protein [Candidatus Babeliales bacterium]
MKNMLKMALVVAALGFAANGYALATSMYTQVKITQKNQCYRDPVNNVIKGCYPHYDSPSGQYIEAQECAVDIKTKTYTCTYNIAGHAVAAGSAAPRATTTTNAR